MKSTLIGLCVALCCVGVATNAMAQDKGTNSADVADQASTVVHNDVQVANDLVNQVGTQEPVVAPPAVAPVVPAPATVAPVGDHTHDQWYHRGNYEYYSPTEYHPDIRASLHPHQLHAGLYLDAGFPSGASAGVLVSPWLPWLKLGVGGNYNYVGEGLSGHVTLDPFHFPVSLTLTGEAGGFFPSTIPGIKNSPTVAYTYESALLGLELGSQRHLRFFLRGGISHVDASVSNFGTAFTLPNGVSIGEPNMSLVAPAGKFGIDWLF